MCYWHKKQNHHLCWIMSSEQDGPAFYCTAAAPSHSFLTAVWRVQSLKIISLGCTSTQIFRSWSTTSLLWSEQFVWVSFVTLTPVIDEARPYLNFQHQHIHGQQVLDRVEQWTRRGNLFLRQEHQHAILETIDWVHKQTQTLLFSWKFTWTSCRVHHRWCHTRYGSQSATPLHYSRKVPYVK